MRTLILSIICLFFCMNSMAIGVKCQVFQKSLRESKSHIDNGTKFELGEKNQKTAYLKTVLSNIDAKEQDGGVLIALKNGLGTHQSFLKLKKGKNISQTFEFPSERPDGISNQVYVECLK